MASTSGSVPYPTSSSTTDDAASGMASAASSGTAATGEPVVDRVADKAHRVVDKLADKAGPAVERLRGSVHEARESMGQRMADFSHSRDEWLDSARESVRRHPLAAVGIAAAVGYLLARLTSDR